jgi:hypothetical protein
MDAPLDPEKIKLVDLLARIINVLESNPATNPTLLYPVDAWYEILYMMGRDDLATASALCRANRSLHMLWPRYLSWNQLVAPGFRPASGRYTS